jgi:hypothetical protein
MIKVKLNVLNNTPCPEATKDSKLNLKNRQEAIEEYGYGPPDPSKPNNEFWNKKMEMWNVDNLEDVKGMLCGNCAAFNISPSMLKCIEKGLGEESDAWATIEAGQLGYCQMYKFKCASKRTCDSWVTGGPVTSNKKTNKGE